MDVFKIIGDLQFACITCTGAVSFMANAGGERANRIRGHGGLSEKKTGLSASSNLSSIEPIKFIFLAPGVM